MAVSLERAIESFVQSLHTEKGYSPLTIREYRGDLMLFFRYIQQEKNLKNHQLTVKAFDRFDVANFLADLILNRNNSPKTRNRRLFALRSFFRYLMEQEYLDKDPTETMTSARTQSRVEPIYMRLDQARDFMATIVNSGKKTALRDEAIMKVFLYCGVRISELVQLNIDQATLSPEPYIKVMGKGGKERMIPLHNEVTKTLQQYYTWRMKRTGTSPDDEKALFLSLRNRRISVRAVQIMVKNYAKAAQLTNWEDITPHKLRHTFASLLYKETKDIRVLQELLGHTSISTTQIYTHTDSRQRKETLDEMPEF